MWGALATGIFATVAVNSAGANGLIYGNGIQVLKQLAALAATGIFSFGMTWILASILKVTMKIRVREEEEIVGLDLSQHGERAYGGIS